MKVAEIELMESYLRDAKEKNNTGKRLIALLHKPKSRQYYQLLKEVKYAISPETLRFRQAIKESMQFEKPDPNPHSRPNDPLKLDSSPA